MDMHHVFILSQRALLPSVIFGPGMGDSKNNLFPPSYPHFNTDCNLHILERRQADRENLKA